MVSCPKCDAPIDAEEEDLDEGDVLSCDECGASLTVASVNPVELQSEDEEDDDEEEFDYDEDEEDEDEEEEEVISLICTDSAQCSGSAKRYPETSFY
jgi:alpha-aminoadipate/glutamate carrier protein LysW